MRHAATLNRSWSEHEPALWALQIVLLIFVMRWETVRGEGCL